MRLIVSNYHLFDKSASDILHLNKLIVEMSAPIIYQLLTAMFSAKINLRLNKFLKICNMEYDFFCKIKAMLTSLI